MAEKLLFITGIQKSGTSLINRVLMSQPFIENPFLPEGKFFWGDDPINNPTMAPCGELYQKHNALNGHQLLAADYSPEQETLLRDRIAEARVSAPVLMNKNPNLVVRLPWVKAIFPESKVILMLRDPVANIYSLSKKLHISKQKNASEWWGVKPQNWQGLISKDPIIQLVTQWNAVFLFISKNISCIDLFINYQSFCENPKRHLTDIAHLLEINPDSISLPFESLTCMDDEYRLGGNLDSKNILLRRNKTFEISEDELRNINYPAFIKHEIEYIRNQTQSLWQQLLEQVA